MIKFEDLFFFDIKNSNCNGCGTKKGFWGWTYNFIPNYIFKEDCNNHDKESFLGAVKNLHPLAFEECNKRFLKRMITSAENKKYRMKFILKPVYKRIAIFRYKMVQKNGENTFNWFESVEEWKKHLKENQALYSTDQQNWQPLCDII